MTEEPLTKWDLVWVLENQNSNLLKQNPAIWCFIRRLFAGGFL